MNAGAGLIARSDITCADAPPGREPGRWTLEAGLTTTAVTGFHEFRTRSLLLSFGVLAVLGIGIGMLSLYAHRAQVLAQRQMEFAMAVSHELRTPLTVIRVAADNLAEGLVSDPKKYGEMIRREIVRLSDMVEQVLVFARTQRADIKPHFEPVSPSEVIDRALSAVGSSLDSAGMRVECECCRRPACDACGRQPGERRSPEPPHKCRQVCGFGRRRPSSRGTERAIQGQHRC